VIQLKTFQQKASDSLTTRFGDYISDAVQAGTKTNPRIVPFVQMLASITASGKTVILADAVASIAVELPIKPVVLWLSKGKVVVEQSLANIQQGGKYNHLIQGCSVRTLAEFDEAELESNDGPFLYFATVGTFNQKQKEKGSLNIFKSDIDTTDDATWNKLKTRTGRDGNQRPLIVVYDESHNLSDQQTDLLFSLNPAAFLLSSASMRIHQLMATEIDTLKREKSWTDDDLITKVDASCVAQSGLVKTTVHLAGYDTPMEEAVSAMHAELLETDKEANAYGLDGRPKAIYVTGTNTAVAGNSYQPDDPKRPFAERQAPPILIWRYLTEQLGVDPAEIAVYCTLRTHRSFPLPDSFNLFKGGDKDYRDFTAGNYRHIIFNLSLQEGWDDPWCSFAYIDKSMESKVQVEQVVGRLLRQPGATHYPSDRLNTAQFFVRVDKSQVFDSIVTEVQSKLANDAAAVKVTRSKDTGDRPAEFAPRFDQHLPEVAVNAEGTRDPIDAVLSKLHDYRGDTTNTVAGGKRIIVSRRVGVLGGDSAEWEDYEHTQQVLARWIFVRSIKRLFPEALGATVTDDPRFDARIGLGSVAEEQVKAIATEVVDTYLEHCEVEQSPSDGELIGTLKAYPSAVVKYSNSIHDGYADLNPFEAELAAELDKTDCRWYRNPSQSGFRIPLITLGRTRNFFPDFLIWSNSKVFAVDTKGEHLITEDSKRKLFGIQSASEVDPLCVRLISHGTYSKTAERQSADGYTLWGWNHSHGELRVQHYHTIADLTAEMLT